MRQSGSLKEEGAAVNSGRRHAPVWLFAGMTAATAVIFAACASLLHQRGAVFDRDDPVGYYVYLRSAFADGDLDFTNDYQLFRQPDGSPGPNLDRVDPVTGRPDNNYTVGFPLLIAPLYALGHLVFAAWYPHGRSSPRFPLFLDQMIFSYGSLFLGFLGLWLSYTVARRYFAERDCVAATVAYWLCSPLICYFAREPFQSHLAAMFAVSLFLYTWKVAALSVSRRALLLGVVAGIVTMVRQSDAVIVLIPAGAALVSADHRMWRTASRVVPLFAAGFAVAFAVQALVWHSLRGSFLTFAYRGERFPYLGAPKLGGVLCSSNHGLLAWHPLIALCLVGLARFSHAVQAQTAASRAETQRADRALGWLALACFTVQLYAIAAWWSWWMGHSFGHRGFLGLTPLFILGLAAVLSEVRRPAMRRALFAVVGILFVWNVTLMLAYLSGMIPYEGEFSWWGLLGKLPELLRDVLARVAEVRSGY